MNWITCPNCKCKINVEWQRAPLKLRIKQFLKKFSGWSKTR